nr:unnamed protein product [Digitaria exilis]
MGKKVSQFMGCELKECQALMKSPSKSGASGSVIFEEFFMKPGNAMGCFMISRQKLNILET